MLQQLLFTACILLAVAELDAKKLNRKYLFARDLEATVCEDGRVKCPTADRCIPQRWFCDGDNDCGDDSDESDCPPVNCREGQTKCPTKNRCKPDDNFCDGKDDCGDNSDEPEECRSRICPEGQLKCNNGQCIDQNGYCNGYLSCRDDTQFTDVVCPDITCEPNYVKCARKTKCIKASFVCDGDNDCGDATDEPTNCRDRSCESGEFRCNNGQCLNRTGLCLSTDSYGCRDNTDMTDLCSGFSCPTGYFKCVSNGKCTANSNLCDGSADCSDGSDEASHHCDKPLECTQPDHAPCPVARRCINKRYFCDTDNDCGDGSDESALFCSTRTCQPTEIRCQNGQCLDKDSFCTGVHSCRDGSYNDKSDVCPSEQNVIPDPMSSPQMPSPEEMSCFMAVMQLKQTCSELPFPELNLGPDGEKAFYNKLVEIDLRELCGEIRTWFECYQSAFSPCANVNNPMLSDFKQMMSIGESAINYVCVQEIEVFNRNKACLLKEAELDRNINTPVDLALAKTLQASCIVYATPPSTGNPFCVSAELHSCVKDTVAEQCGDEVAIAVSGLADLVQADAGCQTSRVKRLPYSRKQRRVVRQLGSGDEEELRCMMAIVSVREACGENPFKNSDFGSDDPRTIYNQLVESDLRQLCSIVLPWYGCVQQAFNSCANVNNPMVAEMKRLMPVVGTALNYVCVQHVDVINRNKACLLREATTGSNGPYPVPVIAQSVQVSCSRHFQPVNGDPICTRQDALETCVYDVVAAQCGQEIVSTLSGLDDVIRSAAGCPARRTAMRSLPAALKTREVFTGQELVLKPHGLSHTKAPNESILFICEVSNPDDGIDYEIKWVGSDGREITDKTGRRYVEEDNKSTKKLYITNIISTDSGQYTCSATVGGQQIQKTTKLQIFQEITFDNVPAVQYFESQTNALIRCEVSGEPKPEVSWRHSGKRLTFGGATSRYERNPNGLIIKNVTPADNGEYTCRAEVDSDGRYAERKIRVEVHSFPVHRRA